jgi:4-carboxymuconolactone decarboxylase
MPDRYDAGMKMRRKVLGDAHVDAAEAARTAFDEPFQTLITEAAWGNLWARDNLPLRERSMLTIALLAAAGNFDEIPMHIRATANTGASPDDVMEALLHVAIYAGVPKANRAIKIARATYREMGVEL